jgi:predicted NBD/HSP70 family sugar kinase
MNNAVCAQTEAYASASNTAKRYLERCPEAASSPSGDFGAVDVFRLARAGDAAAGEVLEEVRGRIRIYYCKYVYP